MAAIMVDDPAFWIEQEITLHSFDLDPKRSTTSHSIEGAFKEGGEESSSYLHGWCSIAGPYSQPGILLIGQNTVRAVHWEYWASALA
jgi:hypothetical protein